MTVPRLGRLVQHDARSLAYPAAAGAVRSVMHRHYGGILDQGQTSSCTGNASVDSLTTAPLHKRGERLSEVDALAIYGLATTLDGFPGTYPPDDSGSSGLAAAKACVQLGHATGYTHAFGLDHALAALALGPTMVGSNWYSSMFDPASDGTLTISGNSAGGHEYTLTGIDARHQRVRLLNSWGPGWGLRGSAWLSWADLGRLLDEQGDVTVLTR